MADTRDLLIEIGTEELPPKALRTLSEAFGEGVRRGLDKAALEHGTVKLFATPRRLAVLVEHLVAAQADSVVERRGPALRAAFDGEGRATKAAEGFARSCGVMVEDLEKLENAQGAWLVHRATREGQPTPALVPALVEQALGELPIPKRMRWADLQAQFVRPVHWLVLLYGDELVQGQVLGVEAGRRTRGHRFHHPDWLYISEARAYAPMLETEGHVIADFADRREAIRGQVHEAAVGLGGKAVIEDDLLDEVTALVEWPRALAVGFDPGYLEVPAEALVSAMRNHQKCFHVVADSGALLPNFVTVSNIESKDEAQVIAGNARVMRARLADADFFYRTDLKSPLDRRLDALKGVVFQQKLGSLYDKSERVSRLAGHVATAIGADSLQARRAGLLSKCDLLTEMVGEFPELQGIMGAYYARFHQEPEGVATALGEQYLPRFSGDRLPVHEAGRAVAIADRLDTLVGIFGIGQPPSGDKDPFALRRAALGVLRIIIEADLPVDLRAMLAKARDAYGERIVETDVETRVFDFMMERLRAWYHDSGVAPDVFEAVLSRQPTKPIEFHQRVQAVAVFRALPEAQALAAANKRVSNILRKTGDSIPPTVDRSLLGEPAEQTLAAEVAAQRETTRPLLARGDFAAVLRELSGLHTAVDRFFDEVMVMADEPKVRNNRLALLRELRSLFLEVADISRLQ